MKFVKTILGFILGVGILFTILLAVAIHLLNGSSGGKAAGLPQTPDLFSQSDVVSLWFGLLGVMVAFAALIVTGIGIGIAVLSIFGYGEFKSAILKAEQKLANTSEEIALRTADRVASSNATKEIRKKIKPPPPDSPVTPKKGKRLARRYHEDTATKDDTDVT